MSDENLLDLLGQGEAGSGNEGDRKPAGPEKPRVPEPPKAKKKPGEKKTPAATKPKTPPKPPEPKKYGRLTLLVYGNRLQLPREGMTEEEVFEFLSGDYPEHTREHSQLVEDKERGFLIPVLKGHRKGAAPARELSFWDRVPREPVRELRPVERFLSAGGLYEMRRTQIGTFVGLRLGEEPLRPFFRLSIPKVPVGVLLEALSALTRDPHNEALANIVYDTGKREHSVELPEQDRSPGSVGAAAMLEDDRRFRVVQIHSHGPMPAFFSATDDADELGRVGLYGVLGRCDREYPEALFRFACASTLAPADPYEVFDAAPGELERHFTLPRP